MTRDDGFGHGRHPDGVRAHRAERADFGGRLVARTVHRDVHAVADGESLLARDLVGEAAQARRVHLAHVREAGAKRVLVRSDERIAAEQVDVVVHDHQRARLQRRIDAAGRVGQDEDLDAETADDARRERDRPQVVPLVEVRAPGEGGDALARQRTDDELAVVADDIRRGPVGKLTVGNRRRSGEPVREITQS